MEKYSKKIYSKAVLIKTAFVFTDTMFWHLDADEDYYMVFLTSKIGEDEKILYKKFENELIAQEARRVIEEHTSELRKIIVARALASTIVNTGVNQEINDDPYDSDDILTDWFEMNNE